jgi:hypothetical protein
MSHPYFDYEQDGYYDYHVDRVFRYQLTIIVLIKIDNQLIRYSAFLHFDCNHVKQIVKSSQSKHTIFSFY